MSVYDAMAPVFDRRRALPAGVASAVRATVLTESGRDRPRILDLGAGSGRIGRAFVTARDDYVGVDLSLGMLRRFTELMPGARLVQADGARLPFADGAFDAVLLVQVLSGASHWRQLLADVVRILGPDALLIVGRVMTPDDGVDALMKSRLAVILDGMDIHPYRDKPRDDAMSWLARTMPVHSVQVVADWQADRTPRAFIERHGSGARFSVLPEPVKQAAMAELTTWAEARFGSLDTIVPEHHHCDLIIHRTQKRNTR